MMSKWTENDNWGPFIDAEREGKQYFKFFSREMERERGGDGRTDGGSLARQNISVLGCVWRPTCLRQRKRKYKDFQTCQIKPCNYQLGCSLATKVGRFIAKKHFYQSQNAVWFSNFQS